MVRVNGQCICPRCKVSTLCVGIPNGFRCDGCGRISDMNSWNTPQADDVMDSPFYNRPDLRELYPEKTPGVRAALLANK